MQGNAFILKRFDGFWMDDRSTEVTKLDCVMVTEFVDFFGVFEIFWIGVQKARYIFPDDHLFRTCKIGKQRSSVIASFPSKGGGVIFGSPTNEALGDQQFVGFY